MTSVYAAQRGSIVEDRRSKVLGDELQGGDGFSQVKPLRKIGAGIFQPLELIFGFDTLGSNGKTLLISRAWP